MPDTTIPSPPNPTASPTRDPFLTMLGERVRLLRARRGLSRRALAEAAGISERHLANLETGLGNASVMLLRQLAEALRCTIAELVGEEGTGSPERALIRELLRGRDEESLQRARRALALLYDAGGPDPGRRGRIALIGLRGAGKSSLGRWLAEDLAIPYVELNRVIERIAGCDVREIYALYGAAAFRRHEMRALEDTIASHPRAVIATGGGLVAEPATFDLMLARCFTVWLRATPEDHMARVVAQGDTRPMAGNTEAMADLKQILAVREVFHAKADLTFNTSGKSLRDAQENLASAVRARLEATLQSQPTLPR